MSKEKKSPKIEDKVNELKKQITANSKDAHYAEKLTAGLITAVELKSQMNKEIDVAIADVIEEIDFGACVIKRVKQGYIFEAKGGLQTLVTHRMAKVCTMLNTVFFLHNKEDKDETEQQTYNAFIDAVQYVFQAPIFASLDETALFDVASNILRVFNEYCDKTYNKDEKTEETEADLKANAEEEIIAKGLEEIVNAPIPPESEESIKEA